MVMEWVLATETEKTTKSPMLHCRHLHFAVMEF